MLTITNDTINYIYPLIEQRARRTTPTNLVNDLVQDTVLKVWTAVTNGKEFNDLDHFRAYCYLSLRDAQSAAFEKEHATKRRGTLVPVESETLDYLTSNSATPSAEREYLSDPSLYVTDEVHALVIDGYTYDEIAASKGTGREQINHRVRTSRQSLKRHGLAVA